MVQLGAEQEDSVSTETVAFPQLLSRVSSQHCQNGSGRVSPASLPPSSLLPFFCPFLLFWRSGVPPAVLSAGGRARAPVPSSLSHGERPLPGSRAAVGGAPGQEDRGLCLCPAQASGLPGRQVSPDVGQTGKAKEGQGGLALGH